MLFAQVNLPDTTIDMSANVDALVSSIGPLYGYIIGIMFAYMIVTLIIERAATAIAPDVPVKKAKGKRRRHKRSTAADDYFANDEHLTRRRSKRQRRDDVGDYLGSVAGPEKRKRNETFDI